MIAAPVKATPPEKERKTGGVVPMEVLVG